MAALEVKESTILSLADNTGLSRGTVFDIVERLKKDGYLLEIKEGKKRKIVIENPTSRLYSLLEEKHNELEKMKKTVDDILPIIKNVNNGDYYKPKIKVYAGERGFYLAWNDIFGCKEKEWIGIARIETFVKFAGEEFLIELQERKNRLGFSSRVINEASDMARGMQAQDKKYNRETRLAPKGFEFPTTEIIYGDKIAMFSTREENIIVVIESRDFAQAHRAYFEMMWKLLEK